MAVGSRQVELVESTQTRSQGFSLSTRLAAVGLGLIVLLGAFLRFYKLGAYNIGNAYYAATVQSMLTSWRNFFFAAFEPGGSVTVDKPPLGFWVQAASAYALGVNGFALALPQALAGTLSIPLLYAMLKRQFGVGAGLVAALALAVMPVAVSTERNNTVDGLLLFVLLLATWAFLRAVRGGKFRYLLLGAFLVGLGFNIKMLQAFLPLPALYALYLLGAPHRWWKRVAHLAVATLVLLTVSLSWAVVVDLTPAESRPFIGSSTDNSVLELVMGHNGLKRLGLEGLTASSGPAPAGNTAPRAMPPAGGPPQGQLRNNPPPPGSGQPGQFQGRPFPPPGGGQTPPTSQPGLGNPPPGQQPGGQNQEVGQAGVGRLFSEPLVAEASWLLPLALLGLPLALVVLGWSWPLSDKHLALLLWGGWLLPEVVYFSLNTGLFHAYYLVMLGPPLAALVGATAWALARLCQARRGLGWGLVALLSGGTLAFQLVVLQGDAVWVAALALPLLALGLGLAVRARRNQAWVGQAALGVVLLTLIVAPLYWSGLTTLNTNPNVWLPRSGPDNEGPGRSTTLTAEQEALLAYLLAHTAPDSYLFATLTANDAAPYILATSRPVLALGGFTGQDEVLDAAGLAEMVAQGELRFVLGNMQQKPEIAAWMRDHCVSVTVPGATGSGLGPGRPGQGDVLYDCGSY